MKGWRDKKSFTSILDIFLKKYSYITIKNKTIELELLFEIFSVIAGIYELRVILL